MILEKNLDALKKRYNSIYKKIVSDKFEYDTNFAKVVCAKNGEPAIVCNSLGKEIYINSRYNPTHEASRRMRQYSDMQDESAVFMFGMSTGIFARELLKVSKETIKCVIYEPSLDVFMMVLNSIDISDLIMSERIILCVNDLNIEEYSTNVLQIIQVYNKDINKIIGLPRYLELFHDQYLEFKKILIDRYEQFYILTNVAINYGKKVVRNNIFNMKYLIDCRSGMELEGIFPEDMPAIVVAAGPSLEKNVDILKEAKGKALIIVVDTAIKKLYEAGVEPDMFSAIDYEKPVELFEQPGINEVPMLTVMDFNTEVLDYLKPKNLFICDSDSVFLDELFKKAGSEIRSVNAGGSVATFTIAMLIAWGFKRIIMVGQDLAMTGNKVHAGDDAQEFEINERYTYVKGIEEEQVIVRKDYYIYLKWIEDVARVFSNIDFIDATEGGALKANTRPMTLREAIDRYCTKEYNIKSMIMSPKRLFCDGMEGLIEDAFFEMKRDLRNMKRQLSNSAAVCRQAKSVMEHGSYDVNMLKKAVECRRKTEDLISNFKMASFLNKYMTDVEILMLRDYFSDEENDVKEAIRMFEKSSIYYEGLAKGIPGIIQIIEECESLNKQ